MKFLYITIILVLAILSANAFLKEGQTYRQKVENLAKKVNQDKSLNWQANENLEFLEGITENQFKKRLGGKSSVNTQQRQQILEQQQTQEKIQVSGNIPETFDSRVQWPDCESIREIRNQSDCGSCWAFGAAEAFSDRWCIASGQKQQIRMSTENLVACCEFCGNGCGGGYNPTAWNYFQYTGVVTGDQYGNNKLCQPYSIPPPDHPHPHLFTTLGATLETPQCSFECNADFKSETYAENLYFTKSSGLIIDFNLEAVQTEIMTNGPVEILFFVYSDFSAYKSGVYKKSPGATDQGGHAVKVLGWGVENGEKYWLCANSWGDDWGDNGYFKILRGVNECGCEHEFTYGQPDLTKNRN